MIRDKDISIIVQGAIIQDSAFNVTKQTTKLICMRVKELFPECELILSTWEGQNTKGIPYDKLIINKDPGATWFNLDNKELLNNCNRLIVSTFNGIQAASRKYILKIRSDLFILSKSFLKFFYKFNAYDEKYKFVKNRILAFSLFSIKGHKTPLFKMNRPFHISDWAYFGYKEDLYELFNIPLADEPEFSQWFLNRSKDFLDFEPLRLWRMPPEQYITTEFLKKNYPIQLAHTADDSNDNMRISDKLLVNNFLVLDQTQFALVSLKYLSFQLLFPPLLSSTAIFYSTWLRNYYAHCSPPADYHFVINKLMIIKRDVEYMILNLILRTVETKSQYLTKLFSFFMKYFDYKLTRRNMKNG